MMDITIKRRRFFYIRAVAAFLFLAVSVSGCAFSGGMKHYTKPGIDTSQIIKIAVMPFENHTADKFANERIKSLVVIDLLSRGVEVVEPGEVMGLLREMKIRSLASITSSHIKQIAKILKVQAVMTGSVGVFQISRGARVSYPEVSIGLMLHEAETSDIIWSSWHTTGGAGFWTRHFGAEGKTLDETAKVLVDDVLDTLY